MPPKPAQSAHGAKPKAQLNTKHTTPAVNELPTVPVPGGCSQAAKLLMRQGIEVKEEALSAGSGSRAIGLWQKVRRVPFSIV